MDTDFPLDLQLLLDGLVAQFQAKLVQNANPVIEAFVDEFRASTTKYPQEMVRVACKRLLSRLLTREVLFRHGSDKSLDLDEVRERFPDDHELVQSAFDQLPLKAGDQLDGYELASQIGTGGMGAVWKARQKETGRNVAVKIIKEDGIPVGSAARERRLEYFRREIRTAAQLHHPHIVTVHDAGEARGRRYLVMEYVEGKSLDAFVRAIAATKPLSGNQDKEDKVETEGVRESALEPGLAVRYIEQAAAAVHFAHTCGFIHRDIKPNNLLLAKPQRDGERQIRVADFGLARALDSPSADGDIEVLETSIVGTSGFMAPEQTLGRATSRSDVFGLGATLIALLAGQPPRRGANEGDSLADITGTEVSVDADLKAICLKCVQHEENARYESAQHLAEDLRRYLDGFPVSARPISRLKQLSKWARRQPAMACLVCLLIVVSATFLVVGGFFLESRRANAERRAEEDRANRTYESSTLAARNGDWRQALDLLATPGLDRFIDPIEIRLQMIDLYGRLRQFDQRQQLIAELAALEGSHSHRAEVLLLQAEQQLIQMDLEQGTENLQAARDAGLPPGQAEYAAALACGDLPQSISHLQACLTVDPYNYSANIILCLELFLAGQRAEMRQRVGAFRTLFPGDENVLFFDALIDAAESAQTVAEESLKRLVEAGTIDRSALGVMEMLVRVTMSLRDDVRAQQMASFGFAGGLAELGALSESVWKGFFAQLSLPYTHRYQALASVSASGFQPETFLEKMIGSRGDRIDQLKQLTVICPEGTMLLLQASYTFNADSQSRESLQLAFNAIAQGIVAPAVFPETAARLRVLGSGIALNLYFVTQEDSALQQAAEYARWFAPLSPKVTHPQQSTLDPEDAHRMALSLWQAKDFAGARAMVDEALYAVPDNPEFLQTAARIEHDLNNAAADWRCMHYGVLLQEADKTGSYSRFIGRLQEILPARFSDRGIDISNAWAEDGVP